MNPRSCGSDEYYCLPLSSTPMHVDVGYYATGLSGARTGQALCTVGKYCPGDGVSYLCREGFYGNTTGLSSPTCSGPCANGSYCGSGSTLFTGVPCFTGRYCVSGLAYPCPAGTFTNQTGLARASQCSLCPAGTFNSDVGKDDVTWCYPCPKYEDSLPGAVACWPGVLDVVATDTAPIFPGLSVGDTLTVYFTKTTNSVNVSSMASLSRVISISPWLASNLSASVCAPPCSTSLSPPTMLNKYRACVCVCVCVCSGTLAGMTRFPKRRSAW